MKRSILLKVSFLCVFSLALGFILGFGPQEIMVRRHWWIQAFPHFFADSSYQENPSLEQVEKKMENLSFPQTQVYLLDLLKKYPHSAQQEKVIFLFWKDLVENNHLSQATASWNHLFANYPKKTSLHFLAIKWAQYLKEKEYLEEAERCLKKIWQAKPDSGAIPKILFLLGQWAHEKEKREEAILFWTELYTHFPLTSPGKEALAPLSVLRYEKGETISEENLLKAAWFQAQKGQSEEGYRMIQGLNSAPALYQKIRISQHIQDFEEAKRNLSLLEELFPEDSNLAKAIFAMARSYQKEKKQTEAIEYYRSFVTHYPQDQKIHSARLSLGDCLVAQGENEEARQEYLQVANNSPSRNHRQLAYYSAAWTHLRENQSLEAISHLEKAFAISAQSKLSEAILRQLALNSSATEEIEKAMFYWQKLVDKGEKGTYYGSSLCSMAEIYLAEGKKELAQKSLDLAQRKHAKNDDPLFPEIQELLQKVEELP